MKLYRDAVPIALKADILYNNFYIRYVNINNPRISYDHSLVYLRTHSLLELEKY